MMLLTFYWQLLCHDTRPQGVALVANFFERRACEVRRTLLIRSSVNKGTKKGRPDGRGKRERSGAGPTMSHWRPQRELLCKRYVAAARPPSTLLMRPARSQILRGHPRRPRRK